MSIQSEECRIIRMEEYAAERDRRNNWQHGKAVPLVQLITPDGRVHGLCTERYAIKFCQRAPGWLWIRPNDPREFT